MALVINLALRHLLKVVALIVLDRVGWEWTRLTFFHVKCLLLSLLLTFTLGLATAAELDRVCHLLRLLLFLVVLFFLRHHLLQLLRVVRVEVQFLVCKGRRYHIVVWLILLIVRRRLILVIR